MTHMMNRPLRTGEIKLGCLVWMALGLLFAYGAYQAVPAMAKKAELEEFMTRQAERAADTPMQTIEKNVAARARDLELPVDPKQVSAQRVGGRVRIQCSYTMPINLFFTTYDWDFEIKVDRPVFLL